MIIICEIYSDRGIAMDPFNAANYCNKFAAVATFGSLDEEAKQMFRAAVMYMINVSTRIIPCLKLEEVLQINENIILSLVRFRALWTGFVNKWRHVIDCLDISSLCSNNENSTEKLSLDACSLFIAGYTFRENGTANISPRKEIIEEIEQGKRKKLAFSNMQSVGNLFLMLNFKAVIEIIKITNDDRFLAIVDAATHERNKELIASQRSREQYMLEKYMRAREIFDDEGVNNDESNSDSTTEDIIIRPQEEVIPEPDPIPAVEPEMPPLLSFSDEIPAKTIKKANKKTKRGKKQKQPIKTKSRVSHRPQVQPTPQKLSAEEILYRDIGDFIYAISCGILNVRMSNEITPESGYLINPYPSYVTESAEDYIQFCIDSISKIVILFINENQEILYKEKIESIKKEYMSKGAFTLDMNITTNDCIKAIQELFSSEYMKKAEIFAPERSAIMKNLSRIFISENEILILNMMKNLCKKLAKCDIPASEFLTHR